jgi:NADH-quinone oxidoreductase subunit J
MLMNLGKEGDPQKNVWVKMAGAISGGSLLIVLVSLVKQANEINAKQILNGSGNSNIGLINTLGKVLFTDFVVPFEISSVLFLSAMVGAVVIGKK